jgi:hypothetical protein
MGRAISDTNCDLSIERKNGGREYLGPGMALAHPNVPQVPWRAGP